MRLIRVSSFFVDLQTPINMGVCIITFQQFVMVNEAINCYGQSAKQIKNQMAHGILQRFMTAKRDVVESVDYLAYSAK